MEDGSMYKMFIFIFIIITIIIIIIITIFIIIIVSQVCQSAFLELRRTSSIRHVLTVDATEPFSHAWYYHALTIVSLSYQGLLI